MTHVARLATAKPSVHVVPAALTKAPLIVMAGVPNVMGAPVLLVRVILLAALVVPTAVAAKLIAVGDSATLLIPSPDNPMICGLVGSLSLMITAPFFAPVLLGVKVRPMMQLVFPNRVWPEAGQLLVAMVKSVISLSVIVPMMIPEVPLFFTVTFFTALVVFFNWLPKPTGDPVREIAVPVPDKAIVETELKKPLWLTVRVPVRMPPALGEK